MEKIREIKKYIDSSLEIKIPLFETQLNNKEYADFISESMWVDVCLSNGYYGDAESTLMKLLHKYRKDARCMRILQNILEEYNVDKKNT